MDDFDNRDLLLDVDEEDRNADLLYNAAQLGQVLTVRRHIVENGVNVNSRNRSRRTALGVACANDQVDVVRFMLQHGQADANARDWDDSTPLYHAFRSRRGNKQAVRLLLTNWADMSLPRFRGDPLLHFAAQTNSKIELLGVLLEHGVPDVNCRNAKGLTALHTACLSNNCQAMQLLINHGADMDVRDTDGNSVLCRVCKGGILRPSSMLRREDGGGVDSSCFEVLSLLLSRGASVDSRDFQDRTPLYYCIVLSRLERSRLLLQHGASTIMDPADGKLGALFLAAEQGRSLDIIFLLLQRAMEDEESSAIILSPTT